jgi:ribokinase
MIDIAVLGSLNMDLVVTVPHLPRLGETIAGHDFQMIPGGKGANQAAAVAKLGGKVAMVGRVGADAFGGNLRANLLRFGVNVDHVIIDEESATGIAMILVDSLNGENSIVIAAGANGRVSLEDLRKAAPLFGEAKVLILQFEVPLQVVEHAAELARQHGLKVVLNPAPAYSVSLDFLLKADYLILNETETEILSQDEVRDLESAKVAAQALVGRGLPVVIVTLGERGALLATSREMVHVPARRVQVVDTTAAGDAFVAGFTVALLNGFSLDDAARYAVCAGTLTVTKFGAQTSLPSAEEVQAFCKEDTTL